MIPDKKVFCIVPFTMLYSLNNGDYRACCHSEPGFPSDLDPAIPANYFREPVKDVWNNSYYKQLRLDMVNGVQNKTCATCWKMEANNEYSFRHKYNLGQREDEVNSLVAEAVANNGTLISTPRSIQIKLGNLCNLKCIMCNQASSNLIQEEADEWKKTQEQLPKWIQWVDKHEIDWTGIDEKSNLEELWTNLSYGLVNADQLQLVGGEPLVNPITPLILERLVECGAAKDMTVYIISNLTSLTNKMVELLSAFKQSVISVSWDHINPEKFRFIRFPADYAHFKKNLDRLLTATNIDPKVSITFNIFNIYDVPEIFDELEKVSQTRQGEYTVNLQYVENPNYFSIRYLEQDQKDAIIALVHDYLERTADYKVWKDNESTYNQLKLIDQILGKPLTDFNETVKERTRVLRLYDRTRKTDYKALFPFIKDYE